MTIQAEPTSASPHGQDASRKRVLVLDNYDSFTYNLVQFLGSLGSDVTVERNDAATLPDIERLDPDAIVISPGPGSPENPEDFGVCHDVLTEVSPTTPTLGVCLGMQGFVYAYGGTIQQAPRLMHGKPCQVHHDGDGLYEGLPNPLEAGRYHSLIVDADALPDDIEPTAFSDEDELMGVRHTRHPIVGVQFHPESILTPDGLTLIENFLEMVQA